MCTKLNIKVCINIIVIVNICKDSLEMNKTIDRHIINTSKVSGNKSCFPTLPLDIFVFVFFGCAGN